MIHMINPVHPANPVIPSKTNADYTNPNENSATNHLLHHRYVRAATATITAEAEPDARSGINHIS
jgi:hypothetical protein